MRVYCGREQVWQTQMNSKLGWPNETQYPYPAGQYPPYPVLNSQQCAVGGQAPGPKISNINLHGDPYNELNIIE